MLLKRNISWVKIIINFNLQKTVSRPVLFYGSKLAHAVALLIKDINSLIYLITIFWSNTP